MIIDLNSSPRPDLPADTTVVVGSGAAGLAVALAHEDAGRAVLLVESGGDPRDSRSIEDDAALNEGAVTGQEYRGLTCGRSRVLGGATQLWHGQCTRLRAGDLAPRPWLPHSGWPLTLADLEPWYRAAETWFGLSGAGYDGPRWAEHARLSPLPWSPDRLADDFTEYTVSPHLGSLHRRRLAASTLVTVLTHATATRVLTEGDRVTGVEVGTPGGVRLTIPTTDVVLAGGAIENARLLMLSDPEGVGLGTGRALTGRYLQDHAVLDTLAIEPTDPAWLQDRASHLHRGRRRLWPKVRLAPAAQEREELVAANGILVHEYADPGMEAVRRLVSAATGRRLPDRPLADVRLALGAVAPVFRTAYRRWVRGLSAGRPATGVQLQVWLEQVPDPESRVSLGTDRDPLGLPVAVVDWRVSEAEMHTSRVFSRWVAEDLTSHGLARVRELPVMTDDDAWRAAVSDAYHPSGTTRMSADPTSGVVDADGQVHGVAGLHVAGSSVFPIAGYANPTLTIVALSLRLADKLITADRRAGQPA